MSNNSPGNKQAMNIVQFPEPTNSLDNCFGVCPKCRRTDGSLNIGRDHWFFCDRHKTRWYIGSNLFSCWKEETEREWRQNFDKLAYYTVVKPYYGRVIE